MQRHHIQTMQNGWFIGHFTGAALVTQEFEVAHHSHPRGYLGPAHFHAVATEINYIVRGRLRANGHELASGAIFSYEPGEVCEVEFLDDTDLIVIKTPSVPNDKHVAVSSVPNDELAAQGSP